MSQMYESDMDYVAKGCFYSNQKDNFPIKKGVHDFPRFVYAYNPKTNRHEGRWLNAEEFKNVLI